MSSEIKSCTRCIINDTVEGVVIGSDNICNYCRDYKPFKPYGEDKLIGIFKKAKKKKRLYDALVPLSGGKDSAYVLYLAVKKYGLKVLTYTFDNSFISELALKNLENIVKACNVDHVWVKHDTEMISELYRTSLVNSGDFCGICGTGIERSMLKISEAWKIPLILLGHSPIEDNSFTTENLYDQKRLRAILATNPNITDEHQNRFLIYRDLNFITSYLYTKAGRFGKKVNMLYYIDLPSDKEITEILKKELNWQDSSHSQYTRHFDCLAEPFSNYIREKRFGYSRRIPQLCNMIRSGEITREEALDISERDKQNPFPQNYDYVMSRFRLTENDINNISKIPVNIFNDWSSSANKVFAIARSILKKGKH